MTISAQDHIHSGAIGTGEWLKTKHEPALQPQSLALRETQS